MMFYTLKQHFYNNIRVNNRQPYHIIIKADEMLKKKKNSIHSM